MRPCLWLPPAPSKCFVVLNMFHDAAEQLFGHLGVQVVTGQQNLGGFVGSDDEQYAFVNKNIQQWCNFVQKFADNAVSQPQAAYAALSKSLQSEWTFLLRAVPKCEFLFQDLEHC